MNSLKTVCPLSYYTKTKPPNPVLTSLAWVQSPGGAYVIWLGGKKSYTCTGFSQGLRWPGNYLTETLLKMAKNKQMDKHKEK